MGSLIDPTSGQESTEMSNFISFCVCVMYLELGGLKIMLITLVQSYHNIGLDDGITVNISVALQFLGELFEHGFILAAPVLLTLFLTEALLGLLSRFTPQLSAFSVAMTIKSTIAIFILSLYFGYMMPDQLPQFMEKYAQWHLLEGVKR
jgi:type III secretion protein T